jgi:hypothetical protein
VANDKGWFTNSDDTPELFDAALRDTFEHVETWLVGMEFMFKASKLRA